MPVFKTYFVADRVAEHDVTGDTYNGVNSSGYGKRPVYHDVELRRIDHVPS